MQLNACHNVGEKPASNASLGCCVLVTLACTDQAELFMNMTFTQDGHVHVVHL